ncbi:hypothetical protein J2W47_005660 [Priestia megaterium]|nr:hypothetical protein [Priestia megaterium]
MITTFKAFLKVVSSFILVSKSGYYLLNKKESRGALFLFNHYFDQT